MTRFAAGGCGPPPPMGGGTINLGGECTTTRTIEPTWRASTRAPSIVYSLVTRGVAVDRSTSSRREPAICTGLAGRFAVGQGAAGPTGTAPPSPRADELHCLAVDHVQHPAGDRDDVPAAGLYQVRLIHPVLGGIGVGIGCRGTSLPGRRRTFGPPR